MRLWHLQILTLALAALLLWGASHWQTIRMPSSPTVRIDTACSQAFDELARNLSADLGRK